MVLLSKQQVRLSSCRKIRNTISSIEHYRPWLVWLLAEMFAIRSDRKTLVVAKVRVIVELQFPSAFLVLSLRRSVHHFVAHNLDVVCFGTDQVYKQATNDGCHA